MIEESLLLIRYDVGGTTLVHCRFPAGQAAEVQVGRLQPLHTVRRIDLESSLPAGALVLAHRKSFERVLANPLSNAVLHARSRVRVRLYLEDLCRVVEVIDDAPGIPMKERTRVLQPQPVTAGLRCSLDRCTGDHRPSTIDHCQPGSSGLPVRVRTCLTFVRRLVYCVKGLGGGGTPLQWSARIRCNARGMGS